jgi:hypothetical protein
MIAAMLSLKWLRRALRVLVAALLVAVVADFLVAVTNQGHGGGTGPSWDKLLAQSVHRMPGEVVLTLHIERQVLTARYRLVLPRTELLFEAVQGGKAADDSRGLVRILGRVKVDGKQLVFGAPQAAADEGELDGHIMLAAEPLRLHQQQPEVDVLPPSPSCCLPPTRIIVETKGAQVLPRVPLPLTQSAARTMIDPLDGVVTTFHLLIDPFTSPPKGTPSLAHADDQANLVDLHIWSLLASWNDPRRLAPGTAVLTLGVDKQVLTARYELTLPKNQPLLEAIQQGKGAADPRGLVRLLGWVEVDDKPLRFGVPSISIQQGRRNGTVTLASVPLPLAHQRPLIEIHPPSQQDCCLASTRVVVATKGAQVLPVGEQPLAQSSEYTTFTWLDRDLALELLLSPFDPDLARPQQVGALLREANRASIPGLSWALYWVAAALPLLMFLWWREQGEVTGVDRQAGVLETLLAFFLAMSAGAALADVLGQWSPALWVVQRLARAGLWDGGEPREGIGGVMLILVAAVLVWPALVRSRVAAASKSGSREGSAGTAVAGEDRSSAGAVSPASEDTRPPQPLRPRRRGTHRRRQRGLAVASSVAVGVAILLVPLLALAGTFLIANDSNRFLVAPHEAALWAVGAGLVLVVLLAWLCRSLGIAPGWRTLTATAAMIVTLALLANLSRDSLYAQLTQGGIVTTACFVLAAALLLLVWHVPAWSPPASADPCSWKDRTAQAAHQAVTGIPRGSPQRRSARWLRAGLVIALLVLVLPNPRWSGQQFDLITGWYAEKLADWLVYLVYLVLAYIVVSYLRALDPPKGPGGADAGATIGSPLDETGTRDLAERLCFLLLGAFVFKPGTRIFYVPLAFAAGWFVFRHWLFPLEQAEVVALVRQRPRRELVRAAVIAGREMRAQRARRKDLIAKVGSGQLTPSRYRAMAAGLSPQGRVDGRSGLSVGMLLGPHASAWDNGVTLAGYSLLLSVPWILAIYLRQELSGVLQDREFLLLALLLLVASNVLQWPLIGFVFGYLYPWVRGPNGLWKGVSFALALVVPWLLFNAAYGFIGDAGRWVDFTSWSLQVFVTCVLTGFLADLTTLWKYEAGWDELTHDVHNFSGLAIWGSSVVAASAGALVTLASSTLGQYISLFTGGGGSGPGGP